MLYLCIVINTQKLTLKIHTIMKTKEQVAAQLDSQTNSIGDAIAHQANGGRVVTEIQYLFEKKDVELVEGVWDKKGDRYLNVTFFLD